MTLIAQFETDPVLINISERHHAWHTFPGGAHGFPSRQHDIGTLNSGREFLQFHRDLMGEFFAWNNVHNAVPASALTAWTAIPAALKVPETGWPVPWPGLDLAASEARITSNSPPFLNDDALGIFIETTIHNWIHGAVAAAPSLGLAADEQDVIAHLHSVKSTWFYKIHGLVDLYWNRYLHPKHLLKEIVDVPPKALFKDLHDAKNHLKELVDTHPVPKHVFEIPPKLIAETPDPLRPSFDPAVLEDLAERVAILEGRVQAKKSPFIKPLMRPEVGHGIMNPPTGAKER